MSVTSTANGAPRGRTIFLVTDTMDQPHGTEMLAAMLAQGLIRRGYRVHLFAGHCDRRRTAWRSFLDENRIKVHQPGFWLLTRYQAPHRVCAMMLRRAAKKFRPVLVAAVDNCYVCSYALLQWQDESVPFFVHDPSEASPRSPHCTPLWLEACHRVTGLSTHGARQQESARHHYQLGRAVGVVYPSSFDPGPSVTPVAPGKPIRFGLLGRLYSMKGTLFAIAALRQVLMKGGSAHLNLFGTGPMEHAARELVSSLQIEEHVSFHGAYGPGDLDTLINQVDVGLMPSIYEGFGIVMLELMARGRPVIATDVGSSQEIIGEQGGGMVVERADTGALADAMLEYCRNPQRIVADGAVARRIWEKNHTVDAMTERYLNFWRSCGAEV